MRFDLGGRFGQFDRRIWVLFYGRIVIATGFSMAIPFVSLYFHNSLGLDMATVGLILLVVSLIGATGQIVGGEIADMFGRRRIMSFALIWRSMAFLMIAVAIATGSSFLVIAGLLAMSSFGGSLFEPASNAMVADVTEGPRRLEAYGFLRIGQNLGWAAGPLIGGVLTIWFNYWVLFLIGAIITLTMSAFFFINIKESLRQGQSRDRFRLKDLGHVMSDRTFLAFSIISIFLFIMFGQMSSTYAVYSTDRIGITEAEVGYLFALNGILVVLLQFPIARWISHYRMTTVIALGALLYAIGYGTVGFSQSLLMLAMNMVIVTFGEMVVSPASMNLVSNLSPENERGRFMGVFGLVSSVGFALGPFAGGIILDAASPNGVLTWLGIGTFGVIASIGYLLLGRVMSEEKNLTKARRQENS
jgi:MFS family permease